MALAWEGGGGGHRVEQIPGLLQGGEADELAGKADKRRMRKAKAEGLPVNIAQQLRSLGFH